MERFEKEYDVEIVELPRSKIWPERQLFLVCIVGGLSMGFNMMHFVGINLPEKELKSFCNQSFQDHYNVALSKNQLQVLWSLIVSCPMLLSIAGTLCSTLIAERFGRKISLFLIQNSLLILSGLLCAMSKTLDCFEIFFFGRLVFGFGYGIAMNIYSVYVSECSPHQFRGVAGSFIGILGTVMTLSCFITSLPEVLGTSELWPYMYVTVVIGSVGCLLVGMIYLPETPKYTFVAKGNVKKAVRDVYRLHGSSADIDGIIENYSTEANQAKLSSNKFPLAYMLRTSHLRKGLLVGLAAGLARGFCGVELVFLYGTYWFIEAFGINANTAKYVNIGMVSIQLCTVLFSPLVVKRFKRRPLFIGLLLLLSVSNMIFMLMNICYEYLNNTAFIYIGLIMLCFNTNAFLLGITPIAFILASEVTPQNVRSFSSSIAVCGFFLSGAIQHFMFPILEGSIGAASVFIVAVLPTVSLAYFLFRYMPETKGLPVDQVITKMMNDHNEDAMSTLVEKVDMKLSLCK